MSVTSRIRFRVCVIVWSAFVGGVFLAQHAGVYAAAQGAASEQLAAQIYKAAGIRGGLVVHVGCGDGRLTAQLRASDRFLVHGLDIEKQNVDVAREHIRSLGLYGQVSIDRIVDGRLPYVNGSVNLLVAQQPGAAGMDEILRVLCPGGVALTLDPETRALKPENLVRKAWPDEIDEWTHYLHGPNGNAIADDSVVGPPQRIQWVGEPRRARQHERLASVSAVVSAGGRLFSIEDRGSIASLVLPPVWRLVARDAFNGVALWSRPIDPWESPLRSFRMGPADLARRLVAVGDRVYVTLGYEQPLSVLDAATGEIIRVYEETAGTTEIICEAGILYVVVGAEGAGQPPPAASRLSYTTSAGDKRLLAIRAENGKPLWEKSDPGTAALMPNTLAVDGGRVFFQNHQELLCLDAKSGDELWRAARPVSVRRPGFSSPTLVVYGNVVLSADRAAPGDLKKDPSRKKGPSWTDAPVGDLIAFSATTGERLWDCRCREVFNAPVDVLVADGLVWTGELVLDSEAGITVGRDPQTGEIKRRRPADQAFYRVGMPHHRCYRNRGTQNYLVLGRAGVEFMDVASGTAIPNHWVRGTCQFGVLPCNGLLYAPPHSCACYTQAKLNGFYALAPGRLAESRKRRAESQKERAEGTAPELSASPFRIPHSDFRNSADWPTHRHDNARSGHSATPVSPQLKTAWNTELGGRLTATVIAEGKVFVAQVDEHTVHALNAADGTPLWSFTTGGRVDSPPTVYGPLVLFGSSDGYAYCLRTDDGRLVWRFRAAPEDRRVVSYGQLESVWPVHGNILVRDGVAFFAAGRSSYLDGGLYLYRVDVKTGRQLSRTCVNSRDPESGYQPKGVVSAFDLPGALPDVLVGQGASVYMRHMKFDLDGNRQDDAQPHLFCPTGLLDDSWWHRSYWVYGTRFYTGYRDWFRAGREVPGGRMLVFNESSVFGFGRLPRHYYWSTPLEYHLFCASKTAKVVASPEKPTRLPAWGQRQIEYGWSRDTPLLVRAMVLAGDTLFVAGPPDLLDEEEAAKRPTDATVQTKLAAQDAALGGDRGMILLAVSTANGKTLTKYEFDGLPVFDGLAAARGKLFFSTSRGEVICLTGH